MRDLNMEEFRYSEWGCSTGSAEYVTLQSSDQTSNGNFKLEFYR
jgi:hypothetical protein